MLGLEHAILASVRSYIGEVFDISTKDFSACTVHGQTLCLSAKKANVLGFRYRWKESTFYDVTVYLVSFLPLRVRQVVFVAQNLNIEATFTISNSYWVQNKEKMFTNNNETVFSTTSLSLKLKDKVVFCLFGYYWFSTFLLYLPSPTMQPFVLTWVWRMLAC